MRKSLTLLFLFTISFGVILAQDKEKKEVPKVNYHIDNMGYWRKMAEKGYVSVAPYSKLQSAVFKGSLINSKSVKTEDSPDVPVSDTGTDTQSETSIFVNPTDNSKVLNSNNSTSWNGSSVGSLYGTSYLSSDDFGVNWTGSVQGAGGGNSGDPAALIGLDGRQYIGFIHSNSGQGVSYSTDGTNWTSVVAGTTTGSMLDKNHLWIDNSPTSAYEGNVYDAWTDFGGVNDYEIGFVRSTDGGLTYGSAINLSSAVGGYLHQGVNINSGPNGEVYVIWTIYDNSSLNEDAIGLAKSVDGGETFGAPIRIIDNTKGIRSVGVSKNHRVNSFPSMAVDISGGANDGNIYVVWTNVGEPGINTGTNKSVYMIKSTDEGATFGTPIKVNQGAFEDGKEAYFPWITCDPESGVLSVIFYDDRDVSSSQVETWVANSYDAGETWEDFRVSDVAFTPSPIPGLASSYMGDYLGISARGGMVYPVWPDNRNGYVQTFVSAFETNNRAKPTDLNIVLTEGTGQTDLTWSYTEAKTMQHFVVYRDNVEIGTTTEASFTDMLPTYGVYSYSVTAMHDDGESSAARGSIQWGNPNISVDPTSLTESLNPNLTSTKILTVSNTGELDLIYNVATAITSKGTSPKAYCSASGGGDEYISGVEFGSISNNGTGEDGYADYTAMSTDVDAGNTYSITVTNGNVYSADDLGVWIDWNQDEDFEDAGENVVCEGGNGGQGTFDITVPSDALGGQTTMRVRIKYSGSDCGSSCGATTYGEVEDYSVNVNSWLQVETMSGTITPGSTENINVNFNSTDLTFGVYTANMTFNSNDTDEPAVVVPVTLHVIDGLNSAASADEPFLCIGSSTTLHANAGGGSGTYTYSWTSNPAGFTSTDPDPTIAPIVNTVYSVVINDGVDDATGEVTVTIIDTPAQANMPSGDTELCQGDASSLYTTNAVPDAATYAWELTPGTAGTISGDAITGTVDWASDFTGAASISVSAVNSCGTGTVSDVLSVTVNTLPTVSLSNFNDVCANETPFTLTGGNPSGGNYTGSGVTDDIFDPATAGVGTHTITYTYSDGTCENSDSQTITVIELPTISFPPLSNVAVNEAAFTLTGGSPDGGTYSGPGVTGDTFDPETAGVGTHSITYTYSNGICENSLGQFITVEGPNAIDDMINGVKFNIYPNPTEGKLFLELSSKGNQKLNILIVNQIGITVINKEVYLNQSSVSEFDLEQLSSGIYFMSIIGEKINVVRKVIVQK